LEPRCGLGRGGHDVGLGGGGLGRGGEEIVGALELRLELGDFLVLLLELLLGLLLEACILASKEEGGEMRENERE
jgi:hypothetical protein